MSCLFSCLEVMKISKLTLKQQRFADEYIISGNAYKSAIKAGYSNNYAKGNVIKLLENVSVKAYINERLEELKSEKVADQQEIMEFLTAAMRGEVLEPIAILDGEGVQKLVEIKPNVATRKSAAELLGKRYRMWTDKQELDVTATVIFEGDEDVSD